MRKLYSLLITVVITFSVYAQAPDKMSYQAVIRNSSNQLVTTHAVGMKISILQGSATGAAVYTETITPTPSTNANGLVSIEFGGGTGFNTIDWANGSYFIKTETDPTGGTNYTITGTSQLLSVPYAYYAKTAETIAGGITEIDPVFTISQAANIAASDITNLSNLSGINTGDQDLSGLATTTSLTAGLDGKVDKITGKGLSTEDYTTAEKTKVSNLSGTNTGDQDLSGLATTSSLTAGLDGKVDKVTGKGLSTEDYTTAEKTKVSNLSGTNTGDQDLSGLATTTSLTTALNLKVDKEAGKGLSTNDYSNAEKTKVTNLSGTNTGDQDLSGLATTTSLTAGLDGKVDKITGKGLSTEDYTTAEKTKVSNLSGTNTGDQDLSGFLTSETDPNSWSKTGNAGTTAGTNFIGTTDNNDLTFKVTNVASGRISAAGNTSFGYSSLLSNTLGVYNTAFGSSSLVVNNNDHNTAIGHSSMLSNTLGGYNTGIGSYSLYSNVNGNYNTAIGYGANVSNGALTNATAIGSQAIVNATNKVQIGNSFVNHVALGTGTNVTLETGLVKITGGTPGAGKVLTSDADGLASWQTASELDPKVGANTTNYISKWNGTALVTSGIFENGGKVGIGTNTPDGKLHLVNGIYYEIKTGYNNYDALILNGLDGRRIGIDFTYNGTYKWRIGNDLFANGVDEFSIVDAENSVRRFVINSTGNIGIGTAAPGAKLEVAGQVKITGGSPGTGKVLTSDATGLASWQTAAGGGKTRSVVLTPDQFDLSFSIGGITKTLLGGWLRPCVSIPDGSTTQLNTNVPIPSDWNGVSQITVTILYSSPLTTGNMYLSIDNSMVSLGENVEDPTGGNMYTLTPNATTANGLMEYSITLTPAATNKMIQVSLQRQGADPLDTSVNPMYVFGIIISYTD